MPLVQREYHLPLPLAGCQSLCVSSQLSASALCSNANHLIPAHCALLSSSLLMHLPPLKHLLVSHAPALQVVRCCRMHILTSFTTHKGCYAYPPTCGDTTWVITADASSVVAVSVHYACSHLCVCARVSTWVATPIAHTKRVASRSIIRHLLREVNSVVVSISS